MDLNDITAENFFKKITYQGDPSPGTKLVVPLEDFLLVAVLLKLEMTIKRFQYK